MEDARMASSQSAETGSQGPFGYSFSNDFVAPFLQPPENVPKPADQPLLSFEEDHRLNDFFRSFESERPGIGGDLSTGSNLQLEPLPPALVGTQTGFGHEPLESSFVDFNSDVSLDANFTFINTLSNHPPPTTTTSATYTNATALSSSPGLGLTLPAQPNNYPQHHPQHHSHSRTSQLPQESIHAQSLPSPIETSAPVDAAVVLAGLQNGHHHYSPHHHGRHKSHPSHLSSTPRPDGHFMGPPITLAQSRYPSHFASDFSYPYDRRTSLPTNPNAIPTPSLSTSWEPRDGAYFSTHNHVPQIDSRRPRQHLLTPEDMQFGSDPSFQGNRGFVPYCTRETTDASRVLEPYLNCLKPDSIAAPAYWPSSPLTNGEYNNYTTGSPNSSRKFSDASNPGSSASPNQQQQVFRPQKPSGPRGGVKRKSPPQSQRQPMEEITEDADSPLSGDQPAAADTPVNGQLPAPKRRKSSGPKRENLTADQKRENHIHSEKRRRGNIRTRFCSVEYILPPPESGKGASKAEFLKRMRDFLVNLQRGNEQLAGMWAKLGVEELAANAGS